MKLSPGASLVACGLLLVGALGTALYRRHAPCPQPVEPMQQLPALALPAPAVADVEVVDPPPAPPVERTLAVDSVSAEHEQRIAALEQEVARLRAELRSVEFASSLSMLAPEGTLNLTQALDLMDKSYLTETPELRAAFVQAVRPAVAFDLLRDEPSFRKQLADLRAKGTPEFLQFQWPIERDRLVSDFTRRLADAGLSGKAIELYRASIADYL